MYVYIRIYVGIYMKRAHIAALMQFQRKEVQFNSGVKY